MLVVGCVSTVNGHKAGAVPFVKDRMEYRYERPAQQVYEAAKTVVRENGALLSESALHPGTNDTVLTLAGRVNQRRVWISVQQLEPQISSVVVQARTSAGGSDLDLCSYLNTQIAVRLAAPPR